MPFAVESENKMKAIEDLVKMQGNSMASMTHAFQAVIQEVNTIKKLVSKNTASSINREIPKPTYAETLMKRNLFYSKVTGYFD